VLDFSRRTDLDEATWLGDERSGRFPVVATIHPWGRAGDLTVAEVRPTHFFGVRPVAWNLARVLAQLRAVRDAGIAVLPELCLPSPDALVAAIRAAPQDYPRMVVCGSAHAEQASGAPGPARVNESLVLLDGKPLLRHRKIHPFSTKYLGPGRRFRHLVPEQLTDTDPTVQVAAGTYTRLAAVICADLNDREIPHLLEEAGVNMLLVPALTPSAGAFGGAMSGLASRNQGVSVVVNGTPVVPPGDPGERAPLVFAGVPRANPGQQTREYGRRRRGRCAVGRLDLNRPLRWAMDWQRRTW
jgi:predicted amidohydrolase